ncbi:MAG: hypothetical protein HY898_16035 [Deltaproteobacteria bacterium]|nr:hypothetical protein [Deltaproteobacteria bacterium]
MKRIARVLGAAFLLASCGSSDQTRPPAAHDSGTPMHDAGGAAGTNGEGGAGPSEAGADAGSGGNAGATSAGSGGSAGAGATSAGSGGVAGAAGAPTDCDPSDPEIGPGANESCNGLDDDCNGQVDDGAGCKPLLWVFVLAGQSNMVGLGFNNELPSEEQGNVDGATIYYDDSIHPNTNTLKWMQLGPGFGVTEDRYGPELSFGRRMRQLFPSRKLAIIKVAEGGTALHDRWKAPSGDLYQLMKGEVASQLEALKNDWLPQLVGFVWMQGESDAIDSSFADAYQANLTGMLMQGRVDWQIPILATTAGLIRPSALWPYAATVRGATTNVAALVGEMDVIDTQDLPTQPADPAHYTSASFIELGRRFADNLAGQLTSEWHFPEGLGQAQGDGFWTCRVRDGGSMQLMTWNGAQSVWKSADGSVLIGKSVIHPGATGQAELGWWAPYAGRILVDIAVTDADAGGGDGVRVEVVSGSQVIWSSEIANGGSAATSFRVNVMQGDELLFRTSSGASFNPLYDSTSWKVGIQMTAPGS